jgi:hypothetical protein
MRSPGTFLRFTDSSSVEYRIAAQKSLQALTILNDSRIATGAVVDLDSGLAPVGSDSASRL